MLYDQRPQLLARLALFALMTFWLSSTAEACVVTDRPFAKLNDPYRVLVNRCTFPVVLSYCQGSSCDPGRPNQRLSENRTIPLPIEGAIMYRWCNERLYVASSGKTCR